VSASESKHCESWVCKESINKKKGGGGSDIMRENLKEGSLGGGKISMFARGGGKQKHGCRGDGKETSEPLGAHPGSTTH